MDGEQHREAEGDPGHRAGDAEHGRFAPAERLGPAGARQAAHALERDGGRGPHLAGGQGVTELVAEHAHQGQGDPDGQVRRRPVETDEGHDEQEGGVDPGGEPEEVEPQTLGGLRSRRPDGFEFVHLSIVAVGATTAIRWRRSEPVQTSPVD